MMQTRFGHTFVHFSLPAAQANLQTRNSPTVSRKRRHIWKRNKTKIARAAGARICFGEAIPRERIEASSYAKTVCRYVPSSTFS